ncbi:hypothetical protein [Mariniphaga sediminis]|uniref:hypothetical protein n=1 Tax=Mariniphaga sediminis TaxID=1628158 RepID=UPI003566C237
MSFKPLIVIDDDSDEIRRNFRNKSVKAEVNVEVFETWDKTQEFIEANQKHIDAVVLDAKGKLNSDKGPSEAHLLESLAWIRRFDIPYAIYTAYTKELTALEQQLEEGRVFTKGSHKEEDVFEFLLNEIAKSPLVKLRSKYDSAFKPFYADIIGSEYEHNLIEMLFCIENQDYIKKNLNVVRDILESIFFSLINRIEFIPESFINHSGKPNLEWCTRFLEGKPTNDKEGVSHTIPLEIPVQIRYNIRFVKNISSSYSHLSETALIKNAFISASYSILEVLEWLPGFIEENFD